MITHVVAVATVRIVIVPRSSVSPTTSSIACAALTIRFRITWLISPPLQTTVRQLAEVGLDVGDVLVLVRGDDERVLDRRVEVDRRHLARSAGAPNSRIARTIFATRCRPVAVRVERRRHALAQVLEVGVVLGLARRAASSSASRRAALDGGARSSS